MIDAPHLEATYFVELTGWQLKELATAARMIAKKRENDIDPNFVPAPGKDDANRMKAQSLRGAASALEEAFKKQCPTTPT